MHKKELLKKLVLWFSTILLPVSVGFIVVVVTILLIGDFTVPYLIFYLVSIISGLILWYAGVLLKTRVRFFLASTFLLLTGILLFVIDLHPLYIPLPVIWPLMMLFIALSFMVSGFFCSRKLQAIYIVPAVAFSALGFIFLLFSTKVITISLTSAALWWFPLFLLPSLFAVIIWLFRKKHSVRVTDE